MNSVAVPAAWPRLSFSSLALACAAACVLLAVHHPVLGIWALLPCALAAAAATREPGTWPLWLLPLLPIVGGMPWTGWLVVEEFDLLALAVAAGAYARWAMDRSRRSRPRPSLADILGLLLLAMYGTALAVSTYRGVADAGGLVWGWWQGYHEPMNSLRLAKSFLLSSLLLPLWLRAHRSHPARASRHLLLGITGMLGLVALTVIWERIAHTGLANFSSDYRATGLFWEMHVGGAALDAALALSVPFAAAAFLDARRARDWALTAAVLALASYACLVTFSRIVYGAVPASLVLLMILRARQRVPPAPGRGPAGRLATVALLAAYAAAAVTIFASSGYRGLLAVLGVFALGLPLGSAVTVLPRRLVAVGAAAAALLAALLWWIALSVPKGAYVSYTMVALAGTACVASLDLARRRGRAPPVTAVVALLACTLTLCAGTFFVSLTWGGQPATSAAALVSGALAAAVMAIAVTRRALWPASLRWQSTRLASLGMLSLVFGVFVGGSYMGGRWSSLQSDLAQRVSHARGALGLLSGSGDQAFGRGLGRYAAAQFMTGNPQDQTGDFRWINDGEGQRLLLTSGKHMLGWGEVFRVSQRVAAPGSNAQVRVRVRTTEAVVLHAEVCEKHLLYNGACIAGQTKLKPEGGIWQRVEWPISGPAPSTGHWFAPRFIVFSLALESAGSRAEFDDVQLLSSDTRSLLSNGGFGDGMSRWFFSSDRHHLPWHAKNLAVHLLFEQGILGCALFALLAAIAIWRLTYGGLRAHPLAPALAASILATGVVGVADSLLDMPRIAFLIYVLLAVAVSMRTTTQPRSGLVS